MRAAIWTPEADIEVVEEDAPTPGPGEVVLSMRSAGICGSDLHRYRKPDADPAPTGRPGHENGGVVAAVGPGVDGVREGDVVGVEPIVRCQECDRCRAGWYVQCRRAPFALLGERHPGGMAEFMLAPAYTAYPAPPGVDAEIAALAEPVACSVNAIDLVDVRPGETVLVLGAGNIGLTGILALRAAGATVLITARYDHQAEAARRLGADEVIPADESGVARLAELRQQEAVDVVFESVGGAADTMADAMRTVRPRGRVVMLGVFMTPRVSINPFDLLLHEIHLTGAVVYGSPPGRRPHFAEALDVVAQFPDETRSLITHRFPIADAPRAFATAADKANKSVKVHINPSA